MNTETTPTTATTHPSIKPIVLACVDRSPYARPVTDYAAWAAGRLNTGLELLHAIDRHPELGPDQDHSGAIGFNEQDNLLKKIVDEDEQRSRQARETGRVFLNELKQRAQGLNLLPTPLHIDIRQRHGSLVDSLLERQNQTTLVVMGRRGEASKTPTADQDLGRNLESVVRSMKCPILTVTDEFKPVSHLMIAYDGGSASRKGLEMVATSAAFRGIRCSIVTVKDKASRDASKQLEQAKRKLNEAGLAVDTHLLIGDLQTLIAQSVHTLGIDLLVMGAYTHSPWRSLFMGSHTTDLLKAAQVPTLLLR
ncbi:universal stress protein [Orrella daihaiensis]|uniref:Universal stress protein n=1 Tax=Orrella daihaiensis TaxID=2782176 RepID=A0ABY4AM82_9BURK|nr:universal stress protein [Orrella daihaiensis]UOD51388.1 universal stress protein [Orrella daihaiensis]